MDFFSLPSFALFWFVCELNTRSLDLCVVKYKVSHLRQAFCQIANYCLSSTVCLGYNPEEAASQWEGPHRAALGRALIAVAFPVCVVRLSDIIFTSGFQSPWLRPGRYLQQPRCLLDGILLSCGWGQLSSFFDNKSRHENLSLVLLPQVSLPIHHLQAQLAFEVKFCYTLRLWLWKSVHHRTLSRKLSSSCPFGKWEGRIDLFSPLNMILKL